MVKFPSWLLGLSALVGVAVACGDDDGGADRSTDGGEAGDGPGGRGAAAGESPGGGNGGEPGAGGEGASPAAGGEGGTSAGTVGSGASGGEVAGAPSAGGSDGGATTGGEASGGEPPDCTGEETCPCYPNSTCNEGLTCLSDLCVDAGVGGAGGEGGSPAAGGTPGEGGTPAVGGEGGGGGEGNTGPLQFTNGWFLDGTTGWTVTGGDVGIAAAPTTGNFRRFAMNQLTTYAPDDTNLVVVSQTFDVPDDALALRFSMWGGDQGVQLLDDAGEELEGIFGPGNMNDYAITASWDLDGLRGERVEFRITDDSTEEFFGFVTISGIDLIRDVPSAIANHEFRDGSLNWAASDGALSWDYSLDPSTNRYSMSSYALVGGSLNLTSTGDLLQSFVVPEDALALRFWVRGGTSASLGVQLQTNPATGIVAGPVQGAGDGVVPVSWDLTPYRGDTLYLDIWDATASEFVGTTGFDLITSTNGQ